MTTAPNPLLYEHTAYVNGRLALDGADLTEIAATHSTPTYVYSIPRVLHNFTTIRDAFKAHLDASSNLSIHYSLKANPNNTVVRSLVKAGAGIDCVSAGEVFKAIAFGCPTDHIVFAGVGKGYAEVHYAVERGVGWFNVENERELEFIQTACEKLNRRAHVALRVNPNIQANTHPSIATGHGGAKFGLPIAHVLEILSTKSKYTSLDFSGLHVHIGSQLGDVAPTVDAVSRIVGIAKSFDGITHINMGGGFPVRYRPDQKPDELPKATAFAEAVAPLLKGFHVMLEPGRSIIADAGVLLTRSIYRKDQNNMTMLIVDASMVEVMRPALYGAYHDVVPVKESIASEETAPAIMTTIVGPVCESTDVISKGVVLPATAVQPEQLFSVMTVGAYCSCMAGNYNARPLCAEVVVLDGGRVELSRRRQTFDDLIRDEVNCS